jgi:hypothetical protein
MYKWVEKVIMDKILCWIFNNFTNFIPMPLTCHSRTILFLPILFLCKHMKSPLFWPTLQPWKGYSNFDPSKQKGISSFDHFWKDALQGKSPWSPLCIWQATLAAPGTGINNKGVKCTRSMPWYLPDFYLVLNIITLICVYRTISIT